MIKTHKTGDCGMSFWYIWSEFDGFKPTVQLFALKLKLDDVCCSVLFFFLF